MIDNWQSPVKICSTWMVLFAIDTVISGVASSKADDVEKHLELGKDFLSRGMLQDALSHYHAAVEGDPENYLTYFKRGTVYLALGKAKFALIDFDKVLQLKPDFKSARHQRAIVLFKQGEFEEAKKDLAVVADGSDDPFTTEAYNMYQQLPQLESYKVYALHYHSMADYPEAIRHLDFLIENCPWSSEFRELRSNCHEMMGDVQSAILDLRSTTKLTSDHTIGYLKLSKLHYRVAHVEDSLREIRECLKLDPEHKECFPHYKKVKKVDKLLVHIEEAIRDQDWADCVRHAKSIHRTESDEPMISYLANEKLCHCHLHADESEEAMAACNEALGLFKEPNVLCDRAEVYLANEMYDDAMRDFDEALQINPDMKRAKEGKSKAHKIQKQAEKRDYYKILGVGRNAKKQEIVKAYRKLAQKWHPDGYSGAEKKKAEKKFMDIASAKEVLTDPEKRRKYDMGEDPLDPESGRHQDGFNPFQQFHHFQGSPFQFKFHFN